jgi:anti-anti-sigma factor
LNAVISYAVAGELDGATAPALASRLEELMGLARGRVVVLDLQEVTFLDSAGLRALVQIHERFAEEGLTLVVGNVEGPAGRVIALAGLEDALGLSSAARAE